jgi:hypothetical protein
MVIGKKKLRIMNYELRIKEGGEGM